MKVRTSEFPVVSWIFPLFLKVFCLKFFLFHQDIIFNEVCSFHYNMALSLWCIRHLQEKQKVLFSFFWIIKVASSEIYVWKLLILITKYYQQQWGIIVMYQISQAGNKFNSKRRLTKSNFFIYLNLENKLRFCNYSFFPIDCFCVHYSSRIHYFDCSFQIYWFKIIILLPSPSWQIDHDKS